MDADQLVIALGMTKRTRRVIILQWFREGRFPAALAEGNLIRFKYEDVMAALGKRAKCKQDYRGLGD